MIYLVTYAKISIDKEDGIELQGVYFGGLAHTEQEADAIATDCVNSAKNNTILPAIMQLKESHDLLDTLDAAHQRFESKTEQMREVNDILSKSHRYGKKKKLKKLLKTPNDDNITQLSSLG